MIEQDGVCSETRRRILLSRAAFLYENGRPNSMTDAEFDAMALEVDLDIDTARPDLDKFFREHFEPFTGSWIHKHPEIDLIEKICDRLAEKKLSAADQAIADLI